jgi:alpha-L-rhamnosidase
MGQNERRCCNGFALAVLLTLATGATLRGQPIASHVQPRELRTEYLVNPLGIDAPQPRLQWILESPQHVRGAKQTAYQILAASSESALNAGRADLWNSGRVDSNASIQITYAGRSLLSGEKCWWKVRVWDENGVPSSWSPPAYWSMGLLVAGDWKGHWIGAGLSPSDPQALYLRRETILLKRPVRATAYICGLGYSVLYLNGQRVGDRVLDPAFTDYDKRVMYSTYDVTALLHLGPNALGVILGNGWYNPITPDLFGFEKAPWRAAPQFILNLDLEYADGRREIIATEENWKWSTGPIVFNSVRSGETYDARLETPGWDRVGFDDSGWKNAVAVAPPKGRLSAEMEPPMRVAEGVRPVKLSEPKPGVYLYDLGAIMTGWVRFTAHGKPGQMITLDSNEVLMSDGTLDTTYSDTHTYGRFQKDELFLDAHGQGVIEPQFTYHGFRYVQVTGLSHPPSLADLEARSVHTDWESAGSFSCSDARLNRMQAAIRRTLSNAVHGIPGEEPTREKMGWTQDGQNTMEAALYNFQIPAVYTQYLLDMIDAQEPNGHVPPIVPTNGWGRTRPDGSAPLFSDPWWGGTLPYVAWKLYEYYGDRHALEIAYTPMKRWVDYMTGTAKDNLMNWSLGDWLEIGAHPTVTDHSLPKHSPIPQTTSAGYYFSTLAVVRASELLGHPEDARKYRALADRIRHSFNLRFLNPQTGLYAADSQTSQVLPLWLHLAPEDQRALVLARLIENIHQHHDHLSTGFVGVMPMLHGLSDWGYEDLAFKVATQPDVPGFLQMIADGYSTMGESLQGDSGSRHHPFGACIGSYLYREIGGIRADPGGPGFETIVIRPVMGNLQWAKATYESIRGPIASDWKRVANGFELHLTIPPNTTARVELPAPNFATITESGRPLRSAVGVKMIQMEGGRAIVEVESGEYDFSVKPQSVRAK